jgi:hypothetical protein
MSSMDRATGLFGATLLANCVGIVGTSSRGLGSGTNLPEDAIYPSTSLTALAGRSTARTTIRSTLRRARCRPLRLSGRLPSTTQKACNVRYASFVILLCPLALGACSGGDASRPAQAASPQLQIGFPKGGIVTAVDRLPLRAAELVAPDGSTAKSDWINVASAPAVRTGQWVANLSETTLSGMSVAPVLTSPDALANAALYGQVQLQALVSQADIALTDPVAYKRDWVNYRVRLSFGTPPDEIETRGVAAPEPPSQPLSPPSAPIPPPG